MYSVCPSKVQTPLFIIILALAFTVFLGASLTLASVCCLFFSLSFFSHAAKLIFLRWPHLASFFFFILANNRAGIVPLNEVGGQM